MKKIGLLMVGLLVLGQAEFKRGDNNLTVIDTDTQLEWQDDYSDNEESAIKIAWWGEALTYCHNLNLDGNGWRLPNINELKSLIVETQFAPSIDSKFVNRLCLDSTKVKTADNITPPPHCGRLIPQ